MVQQRFFELVNAYLLLGHVGSAPQYLPDAHIQHLAKVLRDSMELFVMGHEYGHIIAGHFSSPETHLSLLLQDQVVEISQSWEEEFEADSIGMQLMIAAMGKKGYDLSMSFWGADYFFGCIDVIDRGVSLFKGIDPEILYYPGSSHPSPLLRREFLRELLRNSFPEDLSSAAIKLGMTLEKIIEKL